MFAFHHGLYIPEGLGPAREPTALHRQSSMCVQVRKQCPPWADAPQWAWSLPRGLGLCCSSWLLIQALLQSAATPHPSWPVHNACLSTQDSGTLRRAGFVVGGTSGPRRPVGLCPALSFCCLLAMGPQVGTCPSETPPMYARLSYALGRSPHGTWVRARCRCKALNKCQG